MAVAISVEYVGQLLHPDVPDARHRDGSLGPRQVGVEARQMSWATTVSRIAEHDHVLRPNTYDFIENSISNGYAASTGTGRACSVKH